MIFRTKARRYDFRYGSVAQEIGWGGRRALPASNFDQAMSKFEIDKFDADFAAKLTRILVDWTLRADPQQLVFDAVERRKQVRICLNTSDLIDYTYLGRVRDLIKNLFPKRIMKVNIFLRMKIPRACKKHLSQHNWLDHLSNSRVTFINSNSIVTRSIKSRSSSWAWLRLTA